MNILILGGGGREHCFAWKISQSPLCKTLFIAPGNGGTSLCGKNVPFDPSDFTAVRSFILEHHIDMVVVGPEAPLVEGIVDNLSQGDTAGVMVVGPDAAGAMLEGSKAFAKEFMKKYNIPTAGYFEVTTLNLDAGINYLDTLPGPYVLKADGLASGKGVVILDNKMDAVSELRSMIEGKFGKASEKVVIEAFLKGIEFSVFVLTDGKDYLLLPEAKDYKRIGEGDTGLNTGGMGAVSPVSFVDELMWKKVKERIIVPTIKGIAESDMQYRGFVFFGLISVDGEPYVIEYNCRMGDPETEVVLPRIESDIVEMFKALFDGTLSKVQMKISPKTAATIMLVSGGYPGDFEKNKPITVTDYPDDAMVFHAGTREDNGEVMTNGGRVMAVTSMADDFREGVRRSLAVAEAISFEGKYYRRDIGFDL